MLHDETFVLFELGQPPSDALAYLECKVTTRMELSDHWLVYSTVEDGKVSKDESSTAVHHRKIGNYY